MKNLKIYSELPYDLELLSENEVLEFATFDIEQNRLFFASSNNFVYSVHLPSPSHNGVWGKTTLSPAAEPIDIEAGDFITSLEYLMEKEALIIGTHNGSLLLYDLNSNATEIVGRVEGGVKCIAPSPDGDLLGVITGFGQMLVMTPDWDLLYEMAIGDAAEGVDIRHVSWRGDGKYFATISKVQDSGTRHKNIKVWEREKALMGEVIEWMPSGAKIAAVLYQMEENKCPSIVFYERNGLERSSFSVNENANATIEILKWNCNSDLLAAVVRNDEYDSLKIFFFNNNHWYLKQEIRYSKKDGFRFLWDPTNPLRLICWTLSGQITTYSLVWNTAVVENSAALVVDGSKILVTPLSITLMPPPLYLFEINFPCAVRELAFFSTNSKSRLAVSLSDGILCVIELPCLEYWEDLEGKIFSAEASSLKRNLGSFLHLIWLDSNLLLGVAHEDSLSGYCLQEVEIICSEDHIPGTVTCSGWDGKISSHISLEMPVICIARNPAKRFSAFVQFEGGNIFEYASNFDIVAGPSLLKCDDLSFSSSCPWMTVVLVGETLLKPFLIFGLDNNSRLHVNGMMLCNNCTSFSLYSNSPDLLITHLILATKHDLLFVVEVSEIVHGQLEVKYDNFLPSVTNRNVEDEKKCIKIWERGAIIMGVLHGDESAVILQTTRGNLECIYPRKLVLASITNALVQGRYKDALVMVRRHRIDFNVIVDHGGWQAFLQSASEFVSQVRNLSYITEFVCSIKNENVMETLYSNYISASKEPKVVPSGDSEVLRDHKVSAVLSAIRKAIEETIVESPARELCILTTLARSDPPALEEALGRVKLIRELELSGSVDPKKTSHPSAEECLKHLLWLSDTKAVYEAALGLYDLNLAAIVALNSQQDPKEFLPFLQELEKLSDNLMRFTIDLKLQRYEKALQHIITAGDAYHNDCLNLLKKNPQLFPLGLKLINDPVKRGQVLEAWGDHFCDIKCYEDAATTYLCCSCLEKALKAFRACSNWRGVLSTAGLIKLGKEEILQLAHELCEELQALNKPGEAAKIALEYYGDISGGITLLISARDWEEALRVAFLHRRDDLITEVKTASVECAAMLISEYEEGLEKVGKYLARYLAVRQRRLLLAAKLRSDERSVNDFDDDTVSEASSSFSGMSAYTTGTRRGSAASISSTTSSKARGKGRKKHHGKIRAGSPSEEMALVEHLKGMSLTAGAKRELKSLLASLVMLGNGDLARKLQRIGENFQLSQMAAVKLAEDAVSSDIVDEHAYSLDRYIQKVRTELLQTDDLSWQSKVFNS